MDKWLALVRKKCHSKTPVTSTCQHNDNTSTSGRTTTGDGSSADFSSDQDVSSSASVASLAASSAPDDGSMDDSNADFPDVEHNSVGRHVALDRDTTSSKMCKYDENYISLGFTYVKVHGLCWPLCVNCGKVPIW